MLTADYSHLNGDQATFDDWHTALIYISTTPLSAPSKSVLLALFIGANGPFGKRPLENSSPGMKELMAATGLSRSTVNRKLAELIDLGWIRKTHQGGNGTSRSVYALAVPRSTREVEPPPQGTGGPRSLPEADSR